MRSTRTQPLGTSLSATKWSQSSLHCNRGFIGPNANSLSNKNCWEFVSCFLVCNSSFQEWVRSGSGASDPCCQQCWTEVGKTNWNSDNSRSSNSHNHKCQPNQVNRFHWPGSWAELRWVSEWLLSFIHQHFGQLEFGLRNGRTIMKVMGKSFPMGNSPIQSHVMLQLQSLSVGILGTLASWVSKSTDWERHSVS